MTEEMKAAWFLLDVASHCYRHNPDDPKNRERACRAIDHYNRVYTELAERYRKHAGSNAPG
jgi:hypothetical protein